MKRIITFFVCLSCAYMIFQPMRILIDGGQAFSMLIPTIVILLYDGFISNRSIVMSFVYTMIVLLLLWIGVEYFETYLSQIVSMFFSISCMLHYIKTKDMFFAKAVLITYFVSFVIMAIISIPQFYLFPEMTRQLLTVEHEGRHVDTAFYWSLAYSSLHEIPFLLIPLVALYKASSKRGLRILVLVSAVSLFVALMLGDATTPLLLSIVVVFVLLIYKPKRPLSYNVKRLVLVSGILVLLLNKVVLVSMLSLVQPIFEGSTNYGKIESTKDQILTGYVDENSNLGQRDIVYTISQKTFWSHPFGIEKDVDKIGKHSFIIDHFAVLGVFLIIPLLILIYFRYVDTIRYLKRYKYYFLVTYIALLALAYFKNFFERIDAWFIVPMFLLFLEQKSENSK